MERWRHEDIAQLLGSITIKSSVGFLEKGSDWICPACRRSKAQIVAPGHNVSIVAMVHRHHDHIEDLIYRLVAKHTGPSRATDLSAVQHRSEMIEALKRQFCRFEMVDICQACNAVDPAAKQIVGAPKWFSFSPHGIRNMIRTPRPYAAKHEIDRGRLDVIWDKVSSEIDGLENRIRKAIEASISDEPRRVG